MNAVPASATSATDGVPRIGILVVSFNAESTLGRTLDRIPVDFRKRITEILICDDASQDGTHAAGLAWRDQNPDVPTVVLRHERNLGYGGNQKAGYALAIEHDLEFVVLLHGDGQYAPECLPEIVEPLVRGEADAVFGSRMMEKGAAREGGMPLYKFAGNKVLTGIENRLLGTSLSEFHSGYRAYRVSALAELPLDKNTDDFDFDTQIIVQLVDAGKRIVEIPIPTYYGDEICYVNGMRYGRDVLRDVAAYRLNRLGFGTTEWVPEDAEYHLKEGEGSSHAALLDMLAGADPLRVLDLGCSGGLLGELLRDRGHRVTGVDSVEIEGVRDRLDNFVLGDLEDGLPDALGADYDVVILADVIEHVRDPRSLLEQARERLAPGGQLLVSTPNFGHWYSRGRVALGAFDYDRRGILDATHLRFFMRRSLLRVLRSAGLEVAELRYTGLPLSVLAKPDTPATRVAALIDRMLVRLRPTLFGYQFVLRLRPRR